MTEIYGRQNIYLYIFFFKTPNNGKPYIGIKLILYETKIDGM